MYQYYNYLIFEKNKESFNDINPDLRKMTYKYDAEVKNAYMTVQASPEVIKAAMGMNTGVADSNQAAERAPTGPGKQIVEKDKEKKKEREKTKRYSKEQINKVFQDLDAAVESGKATDFVSPLEQADIFQIPEGSKAILKLLLNEKPTSKAKIVEPAK